MFHLVLYDVCTKWFEMFSSNAIRCYMKWFEMFHYCFDDVATFCFSCFICYSNMLRHMHLNVSLWFDKCCRWWVSMFTTRYYLICDECSATFLENITKSTVSATYSCFSSRMCTDGYWSPEHCNDLLNSSWFYDVFLFFVTDVHGWILKPIISRRFVKFVAIRHNMLRHCEQIRRDEKI
jgi:hypothetical protein